MWLLAICSVGLAQDIFFQDDVQGGISVDASGVSTAYDGSTTWDSGDDLIVEIPTTATVTDVFLVLEAKANGFDAGEEAYVAVNGLDLLSATLLSSGTRYQAYELDPSTYGITAAGSYSWEETGQAESAYHSGTGVGGAVLAVVYEDSTLTGARHVVLGATDLTYSSTTVTGLPTGGTTGEMLVSYGILWECSNEQNADAYVDSVMTSSYAGGRDDGADFDASCGAQDWNSLITQGSFGFDDTDTWVGTDGDDPDSEPSSGTSTNSRLSDELWAVTYDESGESTLGFYDTTGDSFLTAFALVIELDTDEDGVRDADDNCPDDANAGQADADGDDEGDECDTCTDVDEDGYGDTSYAATTCDADCDDTDASVNPGATETWYDGIDADCDEASDYDADSDGHDSDAYGGDDCDDANAGVYPGATDTWYDGIDSDCDGASDYDADADGHDADAYGGDDCDDTDASVNPGATDTWYDGTDSDCDGASDYDADADGHDSDAYGGDDCDDTDASINPDGTDTWYDGVDSDCDGASDYDADSDGHDSDVYGGDDCDDTDASVNPGATDTWYDGVDSDCDGASDYDADSDGHDSDAYGGDDCDDTDSEVNPDQADTWYDGVDSDCDGASDYDADADGHDSDAHGGDDCDDTDASVNPDATDTWYDGVDSDCDGASDYDADADGHDSDAHGGDDCDDTDADVYPGAPGYDDECQPLGTDDTGAPDDGIDSGVPAEDDGKYQGGCSCSSSTASAGGAGWLVLLLGVLGLRRRD